MSNVPHWRNLKHFLNVTTEEYTDGQTFLDILKYCKKVMAEYGKDFGFYNQHACAHAIEDVMDKGFPTGYSTCPGEGFHQEVKEVFDQTNFKNTDPQGAQLARIDENKEALALIRMAIDESDALRSTEEEGEEIESFTRDGSDLHWSLGSPLKCKTVVGDPTTTHPLFHLAISLSDFTDFLHFKLVTIPSLLCYGHKTAEVLQHNLKENRFVVKLRAFLNDFVLNVPFQVHEVINIQRHRCIRLRYQSCENRTEKTDIMQCNPKFHNNHCYDHVLVNHNPTKLTVAHLAELLRCKLPDGSTHDIAVVHMLKPSKWMPKTKWAGFRVYNESKTLDFVMMEYLIRGAHMIPVFDANKSDSTFLNNLIDGDMFIRAGN
ncbi:hypothetical protein B0H14DRAFT_2568036 [Mycena olivaceomarginata]|nr:hypothetical protein B0H14DRAFT_2568036 [Mycena olivaceomarginata]